MAQNICFDVEKTRIEDVCVASDCYQKSISTLHKNV